MIIVLQNRNCEVEGWDIYGRVNSDRCPLWQGRAIFGHQGKTELGTALNVDLLVLHCNSNRHKGSLKPKTVWLVARM